MHIGFCGLGRMGAPMVRRLLQAGHQVSVWNRSPGPAQLLAADGAQVCATPRELGDRCAWVALCLFDADAVEAVVFGPDGLARSDSLAVLIDHSSIAPDRTRDFAARLSQTNGAVWLDAPVSGGTGGAAAGTLAIMAGGPADLCDQVRPLLLQAYAQRVTHMGPVGAGQVAKLCNQTIVATTIAAIAEAVALAQDAGVDAERLPQALAGGWADSTLLQMFVPRMTQAAAPPPQASLGTMLKDLDTVADLARRQGTPVPVAAAVGQTYRLAERRGLGAADTSQLIRLYDPAGDLA
ncbi:NAD(P)-dependent oxidoreductase [Castellaniella sp.]|uniref:NAD(P)-dependent oxidoreductase n=1 Tax=Castellaniella sp. TaxID=1955812 RepID=UPI002AFF8D41|nr:NAD(P)-dependent oxidoreductase [Castellaniella sp.]